MGSLKATFLQDMRFTARELGSVAAIGRFHGLYQHPYPSLQALLQALEKTASRHSLVSSNRLEGISIPQARYKLLMEQPGSARNEAELAIAGYHQAMRYARSEALPPFLSSEVIQHLHALIFTGQASQHGVWKTADNVIMECRAGQQERVRFRPVAASETADRMHMLLQEFALAEQQQVSPLLLIPLFILDFLCIHPFADGNGRISRLLTTALLERHGYSMGRHISLERIIEESQVSYHEALQASSEGWHEGQHDVMPWLRYCWGVLIRACKELETLVSLVSQGRGNKSERVRRVIAGQCLPFGISDVMETCPGIGRDLVRQVMREMKAEGLIVPISQGRTARWIRVE